jgi:hypothetical protein
MRGRIGLLLLVAVVAGVFVASRYARGPGGIGLPGTKKAVTLRGLVGGEKMNLLANPEVVKLLRRKHGLELQTDRRGSLEMVEADHGADTDFFWPSSQVALDVYRSRRGPMVGADTVLNSPVVLYSWRSVTDALARKGLVTKAAGAQSVIAMPELLAVIRSGQTWASLGLDRLYGEVTLFSTDPTKSNSGVMLAGLLANLLDRGQVASEASLGRVLPQVKQFFEKQGFMEESSDRIFRDYLARGAGDKPLIVGYEAQMLEYSLTHADEIASRRDAPTMLYPRPTVWSSHPVIALTARAKPLIVALQDPDFQKLAWEQHGFRPGSGTAPPNRAFAALGAPETVQYVMPMPGARTMQRILRALGAPNPL